MSTILEPSAVPTMTYRHRAHILADILGDERMFGDAAHGHLDEIDAMTAEGRLDLLAYNENHDEAGRFASGSGGGGGGGGKGGGKLAERKAAQESARESIRSILKGEKSAKSQAELMGHLGKLTTKQLNDVRKEHGLKASGRTKAALAEKLHDRLSRGRWTGPEGPMSQEQAAAHFGPKIASEGKDYAKTATVTARPAIPGEKIVTTTKDGKETENIAKAGDHVITNPDGEQYVISGEKLASRYKDLGGGKYQATGQVRAVEHKGADTKIGTAWGNTMPVKAGDMIATPLDEKGRPTGEVYRIAKKEFGDTYAEKWGNKTVQPYYRPGANPTVDNVITRDNPKSGQREILLIRRADKEGVVERGKWALPGGFHDTEAKKGEPWKPGHETAREAAIRELKEETGLDAKTLTPHLRETGVYE